MRLAYFYAVVLFALLLAGCARDGVPDLIKVTDLAPREAELGDRVEIVGNGFPQGRTAHLTFKGTLFRPGRGGTHALIAADGIVTSQERIELAVSEDLQAKFCGAGERADHTTFTGELEVAFPAEALGAPPVVGTLRTTTLDFRPATTPRALLARRENEGTRTLSFIGVGPGEMTAEGLVVREVADGSRADRAGIVPGDVIARFDGIIVRSLADTVPHGARIAKLGVRHAGIPHEDAVDVAIDGLDVAPPEEVELGIAIVLAALCAFACFVVPWPSRFAWLEEAVVSRTLARGLHGKNRLIRVLSIPFRGAPRGPHAALALGIGLATLAALPLEQYLIAEDLDVVVLILVVLSLRASRGIALAQGAMDAIRRASLAVLSALPLVLAVATAVVVTGSLHAQEMNRAQGASPLAWNAFASPFGLAALAVTLFAEGTRENDPSVTKSRSSWLPAAELLADTLVAGLLVAMFLGGWRIPSVAGDERGALQVAEAGAYVLKSIGVVLLLRAARTALPSLSRARRARLIAFRAAPIGMLVLGVAFGASYAGSELAPSARFAELALAVLAFLSIRTIARFFSSISRPAAALDPFL